MAYKNWTWDWRICLRNLLIVAFCLTCWWLVYKGYSITKEAKFIQQEVRIQQAYEQGYKEGYKKAIEESKPKPPTTTPLVAKLEQLFSRYRKADPKAYAQWVAFYSAKYSIPPMILAGIIIQESSCNAKAFTRSRRTGKVLARGLTQVCWKWWGRYLQKQSIACVPNDLFNPKTSIEAGASILHYLVQLYHGDIRKALRHYSGSSKYHAQIQARVVL